jgi:hypothetical protein
LPFHQTERHPQRTLLRRRKPIHVAQHRSEQLVQRGKRQLKLRLNTCRAEYSHTRGSSNGIIEKDGLTRAGAAPQNQYAAAGGARAIEQCGDRGPFEVPSIQHQINNLDTTVVVPSSLPMIAEHRPSAPFRHTRRFRRFDRCAPSIA